MKRAAIYVAGKIVVADSHLAAYQQLTRTEQNNDIVSGFFDSDTEEFDSDMTEDHFYDKEIVLIRHARTDENGPDPPLNDEGQMQAEVLAENLKHLNLDGYVGKTSPLLRCLQTCTIVSQAMSVEFEVDPNIVETGLDGSISDRSNEFPQFNWPEECLQRKPETPEEFEQRVALALRNLPHKTILVTHLGVICNLAKFALCPQKVQNMIGGILPASTTVIKQQSWHQKDCNGETLHHESLSSQTQTTA